MAVHVLTIEREYGCGAPTIAERLAQRLGWKLWDRELTAEIARIARVDPQAAQRCDERVDPLLHRLAKTFWRGSYERAMAMGDAEVFDTDRLVELAEQVVRNAAEAGNCIIVGRGAPYFLRDRDDVFNVFLYAAHDEKMRRLLQHGMSRSEAEEALHTVDRDRAAFIKQYFGEQWPKRTLYQLMINCGIGNDAVISTILLAIGAGQERGSVLGIDARTGGNIVTAQDTKERDR